MGMKLSCVPVLDTDRHVHWVRQWIQKSFHCTQDTESHLSASYPSPGLQNNINLSWKKMPQRSRTSRVSQIVPSFWPKVPIFVMDWETYTDSLCDITLHHDIIPWPPLTSWRHTLTSLWSHILGHNDFTLEFPSDKSLEITFSDLVTLNFDLQPWPTIPT